MDAPWIPLYEIVADREGNGLRPGLGRRLAHHAGDVVVDGVAGDSEDHRDLVAGLAFGDPEQAFQLAVGQLEITVDPGAAAAKEARDIAGKQTDIPQPLRRQDKPFAEQEHQGQPRAADIESQRTILAAGALRHGGALGQQRKIRLEDLHAFFQLGGAGIAADEIVGDVLDQVEGPIRGDDEIEAAFLDEITTRQQIVRSADIFRQGAQTGLQPASAGDAVQPLNQFIARQQSRRHCACEIHHLLLAFARLKYAHIHWQRPAAEKRSHSVQRQFFCKGFNSCPAGIPFRITQG
ncbi:hypothetical protein RHECNPAF_1760016 [Rhizobium etli CNPAF512]|nr:hypothetical protein RHECNPAF_1760016 [Rhizobium etli CNPAF512]